MKIIIFLVGLFSSISLLSQHFECYSDDNTFPNIYNSTSCSSWESYVPKLTTWDSFKDLTVKVNFHFFRRSDGSGTYQPPFTQAAARFSAASRGLGSPNIYLSQKSSQKHHSINLD